MKVTKFVRNGLAGAMIAVVPLSASVAATRPGATVPMAGSSAVAAQDYDNDDDDDGAFGIWWPALAVIALTIAVAIWIALDDDGDGRGQLSRG